MMVRRALVSDAEAIASVLSRSFAEYRDRYTEKAFAATTPTGETVRQRLSEGPAWIAVGGEVVGTVAVVLRERRLYLRGMAVLPEARGRGVGEALLSEAEMHANAQGCREIFLSTTPFLNRAIALYERCGFSRRADGPRDLFGTPLFTMSKPLRPLELG